MQIAKKNTENFWEKNLKSFGGYQYITLNTASAAYQIFDRKIVK